MWASWSPSGTFLSSVSATINVGQLITFWNLPLFCFSDHQCGSADRLLEPSSLLFQRPSMWVSWSPSGTFPSSVSATINVGQLIAFWNLPLFCFSDHQCGPAGRVLEPSSLLFQWPSMWVSWSPSGTFPSSVSASINVGQLVTFWNLPLFCFSDHQCWPVGRLLKPSSLLFQRPSVWASWSPSGTFLSSVSATINVGQLVAFWNLPLFCFSDHQCGSAGRLLEPSFLLFQRPSMWASWLPSETFLSSVSATINVGQLVAFWNLPLVCFSEHQCGPAGRPLEPSSLLFQRPSMWASWSPSGTLLSSVSATINVVDWSPSGAFLSSVSATINVGQLVAFWNLPLVCFSEHQCGPAGHLLEPSSLLFQWPSMWASWSPSETFSSSVSATINVGQLVAFWNLPLVCFRDHQCGPVGRLLKPSSHLFQRPSVWASWSPSGTFISSVSATINVGQLVAFWNLLLVCFSDHQCGPVGCLLNPSSLLFQRPSMWTSWSPSRTFLSSVSATINVGQLVAFWNLPLVCFSEHQCGPADHLLEPSSLLFQWPSMWASWSPSETFSSSVSATINVGQLVAFWNLLLVCFSDHQCGPVGRLLKPSPRLFQRASVWASWSPSGTFLSSVSVTINVGQLVAFWNLPLVCFSDHQCGPVGRLLKPSSHLFQRPSVWASWSPSGTFLSSVSATINVGQLVAFWNLPLFCFSDHQCGPVGHLLEPSSLLFQRPSMWASSSPSGTFLSSVSATINVGQLVTFWNLPIFGFGDHQCGPAGRLLEPYPRLFQRPSMWAGWSPYRTFLSSVSATINVGQLVAFCNLPFFCFSEHQCRPAGNLLEHYSLLFRRPSMWASWSPSGTFLSSVSATINVGQLLAFCNLTLVCFSDHQCGPAGRLIEPSSPVSATINVGRLVAFWNLPLVCFSEHQCGPADHLLEPSSLLFQWPSMWASWSPSETFSSSVSATINVGQLVAFWNLLLVCFSDHQCGPVGRLLKPSPRLFQQASVWASWSPSGTFLSSVSVTINVGQLVAFWNLPLVCFSDHQCGPVGRLLKPSPRLFQQASVWASWSPSGTFLSSVSVTINVGQLVAFWNLPLVCFSDHQCGPVGRLLKPSSHLFQRPSVWASWSPSGTFLSSVSATINVGRLVAFWNLPLVCFSEHQCGPADHLLEPSSLLFQWPSMWASWSPSETFSSSVSATINVGQLVAFWNLLLVCFSDHQCGPVGRLLKPSPRLFQQASVWASWSPSGTFLSSVSVTINVGQLVAFWNLPLVCFSDHQCGPVGRLLKPSSHLFQRPSVWASWSPSGTFLSSVSATINVGQLVAFWNLPLFCFSDHQCGPVGHLLEPSSLLFQRPSMWASSSPSGTFLSSVSATINVGQLVTFWNLPIFGFGDHQCGPPSSVSATINVGRLVAL